MLLAAHVWECLGVAWAVHETVGGYTTAALLWLESGGTLDAAELARAHRVQRLADLGAAPGTGGQDAVKQRRLQRCRLL